MWKDAFTLPDGRVQFRAEVSKDIADYQISAFAVSRLSGFGILEKPKYIATTRQFYIQVEMPPESRLGEQIGIRVDAFNFQSQRIEGLIILHPSKDYKFVNIESDGLVSSFAPKLTNGEHHVLLIIHPGQSRRIHIPIVALRAGTITIIFYFIFLVYLYIPFWLIFSYTFQHEIFNLSLLYRLICIHDYFCCHLLGIITIRE